MTSVAEQNRADRAVGAFDPQHGHVPVNRSVGVVAEHHFVALIDAAVHGKAGASHALLQHGRLAIRQRRTHDLHDSGLEQPAVFLDALALVWRRLGHVRQRLFQHRRRMRVAGDDGDGAAGQLQLIGQLALHRLHEGAAHLAVVERHEHKPLSRQVLQCQGLDQQRSGPACPRAASAPRNRRAGWAIPG